MSQIEADLQQMVTTLRSYALAEMKLSLAKFLTDTYGLESKDKWMQALSKMRGQQPTAMMNEAVEGLIHDLNGEKEA